LPPPAQRSLISSGDRSMPPVRSEHGASRPERIASLGHTKVLHVTSQQRILLHVTCTGERQWLEQVYRIGWRSIARPSARQVCDRFRFGFPMYVRGLLHPRPTGNRLPSPRVVMPGRIRSLSMPSLTRM
jgi:hypothetical protein